MPGRCAVALTIGAMVALVIAEPSAAQSQWAPAGTYCLEGVMEVGSCFRFGAEQKFEYFLSYGAYDETSEGHWRRNGSEIVLDSPPYDRRPRFVFKDSRAAEGGTFNVAVITAEGRGLAGVDVRVRCDGGVHEGYTQEDGYETPCESTPSEIALGIRMFGLDPEAAAISAARSGEKTLVFTFEPGDLGKKVFAGTRLRIEGDGLSMIYRSPTVRDLDGKPFSYRQQ